LDESTTRATILRGLRRIGVDVSRDSGGGAGATVAAASLLDVRLALVGPKILGSSVLPAFGMIVGVFFSAVYAALRAVLALVVLRGRGESAKDAELLVWAMRWRYCGDR
jgi:hypothetical protein